MAKLPGLFQRESVCQLRVMIPKDLQSAYGGTAKRVESLGTSDHQTAKVVGTGLRATRLAEFEQKRRELNPQKVDCIPPSLPACWPNGWQRPSSEMTKRSDLIPPFLPCC